MSDDEIRPGVHKAFELGVRRPDHAAAEADAELAALVDARVEHLVARGMSREQAVAEARCEVAGGGARVRSSAVHRENRLKLLEWLDDLRHDLRYGARALRRSPSLAAAGILTLALAIGANTAIFSAVSAVMLRPLPFADPGRLVMLWESNPDFHWVNQSAAPANMLDWKEQSGAFTDIGAYQSFSGTTTLTGYGEPRLLKALGVTGNFFDVLGVRADRGRVFQEAETWAVPGSPRIAVLSHKTWRDVFGADPQLIGKSVQLGGRAVEIVGVLPRSFVLPGQDAEVWLSVRWDPANRAATFFRRAHWMLPVARLKRGMTLESADAALQTVVKRLAGDFPATNAHMGAGMTPLHQFLVGSTKLPLLVMFGAVGVLLLIACANVANLLLVRAAGRGREAAVRLALGAGRGRLLRQSLAESAVLAGLGGGAGFALGWWGTRLLAALQPDGMLPVSDVSMSWSVLAYACGATVLAAAVFGVAPTVWTVRRLPADVLRDEGRTTSGNLRARRWGEALLVTQVALALALMLGAGLLVRSYLLLQNVAPGFDPRNVLTVSIDLPGIRYDSTRKVLAFFDQLSLNARGLPGVQSVGEVSQVPLGPPSWTSEFGIEGREPMERGGEVLHRDVSPDYFTVMRVPLLKGRAFTDADRGDAPNVVLINETLARMYFKGQDPVGVRIAFDRVPDSTSTWRTIVGVVGDERQGSLAREAKPEFLAPASQEGRSSMTLVLRTAGDPLALAGPVRALVARLDPLLAIASIRTAEDVRAVSLGRDRFLTVLMLAFAGVGLALGIVGIYGVMAQLARRRMREMGIRIALGARAGQVQWLVVRHGLLLTGLGIVAGVTVALGATRLIRTLLFRVAPADAATYVAVPLLVLLTALLASWLPAARAARADPAQVLRAD
ncbi:MAG TPA: ABC transporter permease [Gemmatimonadales bacterium]|nr:ABC transporter permease [Gemmatimonadales bacterium]